MDERNYNRRIQRGQRGQRGPQEKGGKSEYDKERTREEVKIIKQDLVNFAKTSWGKLWINSILEEGRPFRMQRGILYAKEDRIENLTINKGQIFATVQGTAPTPYRIKVNFEIIPQEEWERIINHISNSASNLIELLEGKLPEDVIKIFDEYKYPLFPFGLNAECSCPDKAVPCKHIAATVLYIALVLDYDPFIIMELRGKTKEELLQNLSLDKKNKVQDSEKSAKKEESIQFAFNLPSISFQEIKKQNSAPKDDKDISFHFRKPGKYLETLENIGLPHNLENPKAFSIVFDSIYRSITRYFYQLATQPEKIKKE